MDNIGGARARRPLNHVISFNNSPGTLDEEYLIFANFCKQVVAHTGFEPVISALRGRRPKPLDECATGTDLLPGGP